MRRFGHRGPVWRSIASHSVSRIGASQSHTILSRPALMMGILAAVSVTALCWCRHLLKIPNFWNVVSNLPFIAVGALGLMNFWQRPATFVLFSGFLLTGFGSSYYHWNPTDQTLFWDRLPMTICFMAILAIAIEERIDARVGALLLWPLLGVGLFSLLLWRWTGDLRLYVWVQFFPCLALPILYLTTPAKYTGLKYWVIAAALYALAKTFELYDQEVYSAVVVLSGHTLKHFAAAGACFSILRYFQTRQPTQIGGDRHVMVAASTNQAEPSGKAQAPIVPRRTHASNQMP